MLSINRLFSVPASADLPEDSEEHVTKLCGISNAFCHEILYSSEKQKCIAYKTGVHQEGMDTFPLEWRIVQYMDIKNRTRSPSHEIMVGDINHSSLNSRGGGRMQWKSGSQTREGKLDR